MGKYNWIPQIGEWVLAECEVIVHSTDENYYGVRFSDGNFTLVLAADLHPVPLEDETYESRHEAHRYLESMEVHRWTLAQLEGWLESYSGRAAARTLLRCAERRARRREREEARPSGDEEESE